MMLVDSLRKEELVTIATKPELSSGACCADLCALDDCITNFEDVFPCINHAGP